MNKSFFRPWMILLVMPLVGLVIMVGVLLSADETEQVDENGQIYLDDSTPPAQTLPPRTPLPSPTTIYDQPVPDIELVDLDGQTYTLQEYQGRPLIINFWASWCQPCREEMPAFQTYADEMGADGPVIIIVTDPDNGQTMDDIRAFVEEFDLDLRVGIDQNAWLHYSLNVPGLPSTYFVDADGILRGRRVGMIDYQALVDEVALLDG